MGQVVERKTQNGVISMRVRMRKSLVERLLRVTPYVAQISRHGGKFD